MWVWFTGEHMVLFLLSVAILLYEKKFRYCAWGFFAIQCADTVDFLLTYSEPWGNNKWITFNFMKCVVFLIVMFLDFISHVGHTERN